MHVFIIHAVWVGNMHAHAVLRISQHCGQESPVCIYARLAVPICSYCESCMYPIVFAVIYLLTITLFRAPFTPEDSIMCMICMQALYVEEHVIIIYERHQSKYFFYQNCKAESWGKDTWDTTYNNRSGLLCRLKLPIKNIALKRVIDIAVLDSVCFVILSHFLPDSFGIQPTEG